MLSDRDELCHHYLNMLYQNVQAHSALVHAKTGVVSESNGEILYASVDKLLRAMPLTEHDVFIDLGSGSGKVVVQAFLTTPIQEAVGIEIRPDLHQQAMAAVQRIQQNTPDFYLPNRKLTFLLGSFFDIPLTMATVVFINATCFTQPMIYQLGELINRTPNIHSLLTTRPLPSLQRLHFKQARRIECSWDSALCYVYGN